MNTKSTPMFIRLPLEVVNNETLAASRMWHAAEAIRYLNKGRHPHLAAARSAINSALKCDDIIMAREGAALD